MSYASPAVLPPPAPTSGVILVPIGQNSRIQFVDADGNILGTLLYLNADTGKIRCNVSTLDPDKLGNVVEIDPVDGCIVVDRPA